jgi:dinuclear metal center YbgI/SA1388 family protein
MKINEIISALEDFAAPELQEDYDNAGLITGSKSWECNGVLCSLDVTEDVVNEAVEKNCNLIVAHHPIIFKGLKTITGKNYVERTVLAAIKNDVAIYALHTNLDNIKNGVNGYIANKLSIPEYKILAPKHKVLRRLITFVPIDKAEDVRQALFNAGAGHIGKYKECSFNSEGTGTFKAVEGADPYVGEVGERHEERETKIEIVYPAYLEVQVLKALIENHPYEEVAYDIFSMENVHRGIGSGIIGDLKNSVGEEEFLERLKILFQTPAIRHTSLLKKAITKVAFCGGAGSFLIKKAISEGANIFITADIKYHDFFEADRKLVVADIGHFESEQFTIDLIHDLIVEKFSSFAVLKTGVATNPVRYYL